MAKRLSRLLRGLKQYYSAPLSQSFRKFRNGLMYFSFGLILIVLANWTLQPSLRQELISLVGILFVALGFFIAMTAHMRMLIGRILRFFTRK